MHEIDLPSSLDGLKIHLVGAKGTGMAAFAEILSSLGAVLSGSDVAEVFYTDAILREIGLDLRVGFDANNLPRDASLVIYSAAYSPESNPELVEAARRSLKMLSYPEALGALSRRYDSSGIAGVHGKTTTTAMCGSLVVALGLPATVLAGSAISTFGGRCTMVRGDQYLIAETCEYRRHFLSFSPNRIVLTSVESDHQDYYPSYDDILAAFIEYAMLLPKGGELIYCADDAGASEAAERICALRPDIHFSPYGFSAQGDYRILSYETAIGRASFRLAAFPEDFTLHVPGRHLALDATAAIALALSNLRAFRLGRASDAGRAYRPTADEQKILSRELSRFSGSKRRSEILGESGGVLFMDDYGHHPTAIRETIRGFKEFWPDRRLIVDFMPHTYSRTKALFDEFVSSLDGADLVILHKIYASAREAFDPTVSGRNLFESIRRRRSNVYYYEDPMDSLPFLRQELRAGDLFLTMGAGDNWKVGSALLGEARQKSEGVL